MINFLKYRTVYFLISAIVIGSGLFSIVRWGYNYSIDFIGGTNLEYQLDKQVSERDVRSLLSKQKVEAAEVKVDGTTLLVRAKPINEKQEKVIKDDIEKTLQTKVTVLRSETVGPTLGAETIRKTIIAAVIAIIGILLYMSFAFKSFNFALAAIIALFHDFLVVIGVYSLLNHFLGAQFDTLFVTALLTTMSFSVHDTIVIFDKVREHRQNGEDDIRSSINKALTETSVRSINNSLTIMFMLLALVLLGGTTIRFFVMALLVGTITGAYSSPFVAAPVLELLEKLRGKK